MLAWLLAVAVAVAQEPTDTLGPPEGEVVNVRTTELDVYGFDVPTCDKVKALSRDARPVDVARTKALVVTLRNTGSSMCLYKGVSLQGTLSGVYTSSQRNPEGTGLFLAPRGELSLRIVPDRTAVPRVAIELQIPPGSGTIILVGLGPEDALPAVPVTPTAE